VQHSGLVRFIVRRTLFAVVLVFVVSSASLLLARYAPPEDAFGTERAALERERHRLGYDDPLVPQYTRWLARGLRLDFGESLRFRRPVSELVRERAGNTALLGITGLLLATAIGIPLGVFTGSRERGLLVGAARLLSIVLLSLPSLVTSLVLLLLAARTGWLPAGGLPQVPSDAGVFQTILVVGRYLLLPSIALALPVAASIERLQSRSLREVLSEPCIIAALGRGVPYRRVIWRHALLLSLKPVIAIYGITIGAVLSGSFVVEIVMSWQGLGDLMFQALQARDLYLIAGCAATGSAGLAAGILLSDLALVAVDPRVEELG
jgi:peptide/nickel transport system permease protein